MRAGIMTFSRAENSGSSWWNWNTKPIWRLRKSASLRCDSRVMSWPPNVTEPLSALSREPIICRSVVLPAPEGPTMLTTSPFSMVRFMPLSTSSEPKLFFISLICIMSLFVLDGGVLQVLFLCVCVTVPRQCSPWRPALTTTPLGAVPRCADRLAM